MSKPLTLVALVLDRSGSIGQKGLTEDARQFYNSTLDSLKQRTDQDVLVARIGFHSYVEVETPALPVKEQHPLRIYHLGGNTALFDGIAKAIETLRETRVPAGRDVSFLVLVVTDGEENYSVTSSKRLADTIAELEKTGRWTIGLNLPTGHYRERFLRQFPAIPKGNVREWETTQEGMRETTRETARAVTGYLDQRARGVTAVKQLYRMTTDLHEVSHDDLSKLTDLSENFRSWTVEKEVDVSTFVQEKTKKPYVIGSAYYQLMKRELVQQSKELVVTEKGSKKVYGGKDARKLLGIPADGDVKITPGNHANFDIFVQSRSVNRKLPRGTRLLLRKDKTTDDVPTWDHTLTKAK